MTGSQENASTADVQSLVWEGHDWSDWYKMEKATVGPTAKAPDVPGLYRVRCVGRAGLTYIGETGRSLRDRLRQLKSSMKCIAENRPNSVSHVAGGCVWKESCEGSIAIEVSWVEKPDMDKRERKGIECELISAYRKIRHDNPVCQFGGNSEDDKYSDTPPTIA